MTVKELLARIDSRELAEWIAFNSTDPIDQRWRTDLAGGVVASTIANVNRTKSSKTFTPSDFMPMHQKPEPEQQSDDEMKDIMKQMAGLK